MSQGYITYERVNKLDCLSLAGLCSVYNYFGLHFITLFWHHDTQHNATQNNDIQHNDTQHIGQNSRHSTYTSLSLEAL